MKIVQTFWSGGNRDLFDNKGWLSFEYHWLGWILSCNRLRTFYEEVELYTDNFGYEILIEKLKLPYTKVHVVLESLACYPKELWAISKIKTYSLQKEPFLHVDGDIFIWDRFPQELVESDLMVQNLENTTSYYRSMWAELKPFLKFFPTEIYNYDSGISQLGCNMGLFGGKDVTFINKYSEKSFEFVDKNIESWKKLNLLNFNIFFEQQLFYEMSCLEKKNINFLFDEVWGDNAYLGLGNFPDIPHKRSYLHLLGNFKRRQNICMFLATYVLKEFPEFYLRLKNLLSSENYSFFENLPTYSFTKPSNLKLLQRTKNNLINGCIKFNDENLFARNLIITEMFKLFDKLIEQGEDFNIILLNCFEINQDEVFVDNENFNLKVLDINNICIYHDFDEIDKLIVDEIKTKISMKDFLNRMKGYLDEDASEVDFVDYENLLISRLRFFLEYKIILIEEQKIKN